MALRGAGRRYRVANTRRYSLGSFGSSLGYYGTPIHDELDEYYRGNDVDSEEEDYDEDGENGDGTDEVSGRLGSTRPQAAAAVKYRGMTSSPLPPCLLTFSTRRTSRTHSA